MPFMDDNLFLCNDAGKSLFFNIAKEAPIFDFHCHLNPVEIEKDHRYGSIGELMLGGDHYKWRAMRSAGVPEEVIFRKEDAYKESFFAYAQMLELAAGNPLLHWTHLELRRVFGITDTLNRRTADKIWKAANEKLTKPGFSARGLIERFNVRALCTTDDPADSLTAHAVIAADASFKPKVLPAFRPDRALNLYKPDFADYIQSLGKAAGQPIADLDGLLLALSSRLDFFHSQGARLSDHGLEAFDYRQADAAQADRILKAALSGQSFTDEEFQQYRSYLLVWLGGEYHKRGWAQQYHIGALRNNNTRMFQQYGPDIGMDSIGDGEIANSLSRLLDAMAMEGMLPKTILYSINPKDNYTLGAMIGNFQGQGKGYLQWGAPWWFGDQRDGIEEHLKALGNLGLLGAFVGMLTDSRSFTSYTRHEYFRRVLCNLLGQWVERGELPEDMAADTVRAVCFDNAAEYFGIDLA